MIECVGYHTEEITIIKNKSSQNAMLASVGLGGPFEGMKTETWLFLITRRQGSTTGAFMSARMSPTGGVGSRFLDSVLSATADKGHPKNAGILEAGVVR